MYFHFLDQLLLLVPLFNGKSNGSTSSLNFSTWESESGEDLTKWNLEEETKEHLHIFPTIPAEIPVCCDLDPGTTSFSCEDVKSSQISIREKKHNSKLRRYIKRVPKCALGSKHIVFDQKSFAKRFLKNGYFGFKNEFYSPDEYCLNGYGLTGEFVDVKICTPECSGERPCIQKCCAPDEIYSFSQRKCIKSNSDVLYNPIFYQDLSNKVGEEEQKSLRPHFTIRFPRSFKSFCEGNTTQIFPAGIVFAEHLSNFTGRKYFPAAFRVRKDGNILYRKDGKAILLPDGNPIYLKENSRKCYVLKTKHYCIDGATEYGHDNDFNNDEGQTFLATCSELLYQPPIIGPLSFVYGNVMICSSFCSLLTAVVYLTLREKRKNIHGLTVASYAISMFFMYVFLGLAHLFRYYGSDAVLKSTICIWIGIGSHLFSLCSFLWLTMMNWDLWWTFRPIVHQSPHKTGKIWISYLKYSIFGWGVPLMIIAVSSYLHFTYEDASENNCADVGIPLPAYGRESCEIKQLSLGVYLYFPATGLLLCNLVFFIVTVYSIYQHGKATQMVIKRIQERQHQSIQLFGKLFFVMGVTRVFEVVTWYESGPNLTWYWAVFDIFNILQAFAIFIIYVCKKDVLLGLRNKHKVSGSRGPGPGPGYEGKRSKVLI